MCPYNITNVLIVGGSGFSREGITPLKAAIGLGVIYDLPPTYVISKKAPNDAEYTYQNSIPVPACVNFSCARAIGATALVSLGQWHGNRGMAYREETAAKPP